MNPNSAKILVMCLADASKSPRPRRMIELCSSMGFEVEIMSFADKNSDNTTRRFSIPAPATSLLYKVKWRILGLLIALTPFEKIKIYFEKLRYGLTEVEKRLINESFDLLVVENLQLLPLAFGIKGNAKVLFDAREFYPRQNEGEIWFELIEKKRRIQLCSEYLKRCDAVVTVSIGLMEEYRKCFGVTAELFRSVPYYVNSDIHLTNPYRIRMVYHGVANRNRRLDNLIKIVSLLDDRFSLDLILVDNERYQRELKRKAASVDRIVFKKPVPFNSIVSTLSQYDIGFFYYEPTGFNILHCLPNKFFEYIQARLMLAIGPSPDMAQLVEEYKCGVVAESFSVDSMVKALNSLTTADIEHAKKQANLAATELCFEQESKKMKVLLKKLLNKDREVSNENSVPCLRESVD